MSDYPTIVADPPWPMAWRGGAVRRKNGRGEWHYNRVTSVKTLPYPTMSVEEICALDVASLAADAAHLYLWIPDSFLVHGAAAAVAEAWGFEPGRLLIWRKAGFGLGTFPRPQHEACVVCKRGKLPFGVRDAGSVQDWKLPYSDGSREHSRKPDGFLDLVERASPGPYLELFARRQRIGWDTWGNQAAEHVELGRRPVPEQEVPPCPSASSTVPASSSPWPSSP